MSVSAGCPAPEPGSSDPSPGVDAEPGSSPGVSRDARDVSGAASTAPVPSSGGTGEAAGSAVVGTGRNAEEDTPSSDGVRDSSSWVVAQEDESFVDAVHFIGAVHGLRPPRGGPGSSMGQVWTMALLKGNQCSPFALPLSARSVSLRERTDACLASMGSKHACSFIYPPPVRDHRFYQPSDRRFGAPLSISSDLVKLSSLQGSEMRSVSVSVPHHLLTSLEVSAGATCETSSWLDWWTTSLSGFLDDLPLDKRSLFQGLVSAGDRTLQHVSQHAVGSYSNLVLLHMDRLLQGLVQRVPPDSAVLLRNAGLPSDSSVFPTALVASALDRMCAAGQDTPVSRPLAGGRIPRVSSASHRPESSATASSGLSSATGVSPVVPRTTRRPSSPPSSSSEPARKKRRRRKKLSGALHGPASQ